LLEDIQRAVQADEHRFSIHAISRAGANSISLDQVEQALLSDVAEVIEEYPTDPRGASCLVYGKATDGTVVHVVCSRPPGVAVITCYQPDPARWEADLKSRKQKNE
jgi:hypothetical protein